MKSELQKLRSILTREEKWWMVLVLTSMLLVAALEVVSISSVPLVLTFILEPDLVERYPVPEFLSNWVERTTATERLVWGGSIFLAVFSLRTAAVVGSRYLQLLTAARRQTRLATRLFSAYVHAPYELFLVRDSSELVRNLQSGAMRAAGEIVSTLLALVQNAIVLLAVVLLLAVSNFFVTLVSLSVLGLFGFLFMRFTSVKASRLGNQEMEQRKLQLKELRQIFEGIREIKVTGSTEFFTRKFSNGVSLIANAQEWKLFMGFLAAPLMELLAILALLLVPAMLLYEGHSIRDSGAMVSMFALAFFRLKTNLSSILGALTSLRFNLVNLAPIYNDLLAGVAPASSGKPKPVDDTPQPSDIVLSAVCYRYPQGERAALDTVTVRIPQGARVALTGNSGSGKSTLLDILLGVLKPASGTVTVGEMDIHSNLDAWHTHIAHVPQRVFLLNDSIRHNVAFGIQDGSIDDARVWDALAQVQMKELVMALPDGLDTNLNERGLRLSGGQQQRIGIARALYRRPGYLILDEPTASLDNDSELLLLESLSRLPQEVTVIMTAHRPATLQYCNMVLTMQGGKLVDSTKPDCSNGTG